MFGLVKKTQIIMIDFGLTNIYELRGTRENDTGKELMAHSYLAAPSSHTGPLTTLLLKVTADPSTTREDHEKHGNIQSISTEI